MTPEVKLFGHKSGFNQFFAYLCNGAMAMLLSHTYLFWIFYCRNLQSSNFATLNNTKISNQMSAFGVYPYHQLWLGVCDISSGVGFLCCLFVLGQRRPEFWVS